MAVNFTFILGLILFSDLVTDHHTNARSLVDQESETAKQGDKYGNLQAAGNEKEISVGKLAESKEFGREMKNLPPLPNIPGIPIPSIPGFPNPPAVPLPDIPIFRPPFDNIPGVPPLPSIPNLPPLPPLPNIPFPFLSPPPS
ncbi:hypothetical protein L484_025936 [Morus notabilis]|uniref:Uncharacterized protein n=1 Tax=Morus notabilis TaxID=981085 RepID=W9RW66_9ROSA|nr:ENHANCER OF AG-4 protein 2 [Morus notabilis]EXB75158.1 hypothetical protein L484_025936 [Morus notabilis]